MGSKRLWPSVSVAGCALSCRCWVSPAPQNVGLLGTLSALNSLRLFMALCCFLESRLLSVSFQPQAACVAPPQCCQLGSETPQPLCSLGRFPALCLQTPALLPPTPSRGTRAAAPVSLGKLCPAWLGKGPWSPCPSFLSSPILLSTSGPENGLSPWRILSQRGRSLCSTPVWNGESRRCGHGRPWEAEPPAGAVGGPRSAAVRPFPDKWGLGHTDRGIFVFLLLCH